MDASASAHVGSAGRYKLKQQNAQGNLEIKGSQGALAAVLATVQGSLAKQAEGLTRLEELLKTSEMKQEASFEELTKKIRKEKPYSFKCKIYEVQHDFNDKMKETRKTAVEALEKNFRDPDKVTATKKAIDEGIA